ncbi:MAG TPA: cellulase family glycosylhydrolase [Gaiellaceae bacterium]|nr:cellulase family glycosylhydrolase [Gaiellaceae bacterium]
MRVLVLVIVLALPASAAAGIRVSGNLLVNDAGKTVRLLGVNRSGLEYACVQGWGFSDGPVDAASISAMKTWGIDAVRVPLNEDCWLGINGVKAQYGGGAYRSFVKAFVSRLNAAGLTAILDLHWNAPGSQRATGQEQMPDADHSPAFWRSVARTFRSNRNVIFDLYNEPHDVSWRCWRDGCGQWAGMQRLVNAVRSAGGMQPLMLGGLAWSNDLSGWLRWRPRDPLHQLIASFHLYNFATCNTVPCWNTTVKPVAAVVPVVTGELGENDCGHGFIDRYMPWADAMGVSYLGWTWDTWNCNSGPALISGYDGTPTAFGAGFRAHLASLQGR